MAEILKKNTREQSSIRICRLFLRHEDTTRGLSLSGIRIRPPVRQRKNKNIENGGRSIRITKLHVSTYIGCFWRVISLALVPGSNRCFKNPALLGRLRSADEISTNGFSSSSWPETNFRRQPKIAAAARGAARNSALQTATSRDSARPGDAFKQRQRSASVARAAASSGASSSAAADHLARSVSAGAASRAAGARPACGQCAQRLVADRRNTPGSGASTVRDQDAASAPLRRAPCTASAYDMRVQACARDALHEEEPPHAAADGRFLIFDLQYEF
ncbi:hypothetical protein F511_21371 [Dorcoceras hygrometricum]|uniref:Uncharacterized protein n=1 Tax=Dorcoceras hygrometricum TaxID=472368 RepID=A0A2Z7BTV6_9LAMI|nr:hypothetical protein F511_21371 [Dorcoceras hygrometricum]